jgi:hypothetical protein
MVVGACEFCDVGGYRVALEKLRTRPFEVLAHVANKNGGVEAVGRLLRWLDYEGARALDLESMGEVISLAG